MKIQILLTVFAILFSGQLALLAQPANVQQFQSNQQAQQFQIPPYGLKEGTNAPDLFPGESTDVGPQRILKLNPRPNYFNVYFDSQVYYSDNANYAQGRDIIGSSVFVNTGQAALTPPEFELGQGKMGLAAGIISQWYNYGSHQMTSENFTAETAFISSRFTYHDWVFSLGGNFTRLLDQNGYDWTYQEFLPVLAVQRFFPIGERLLLVVGNQVDYHFSDEPPAPGTPTDINNRFDDIVNVGFSWQMTRHLVLQPYGRFQYSNYRYDTLQTSGRTDYLYSTGITLACYFNKNFSLRTFFNYNVKQTDDSYSPAYHEYNGGLGGSLNFDF